MDSLDESSSKKMRFDAISKDYFQRPILMGLTLSGMPRLGNVSSIPMNASCSGDEIIVSQNETSVSEVLSTDDEITEEEKVYGVPTTDSIDDDWENEVFKLHFTFFCN